MKNSKEYSKKIQTLYRSLKRKYAKPKKIIYDEPLDAIVYAIVSENITNKQAESAFKRIKYSALCMNDPLKDSAKKTTAPIPINAKISFQFLEYLW